MWYFIMIMCVIMMFLFCLTFKQLNILQDKKNNAEIRKLKENIDELKTTNAELRELRRQEVNNNTHLVNRNKELYMFCIEVGNILNGNRTPEDKVQKLKELVEEYKSNTNSKVNN